MTTTTKAAPKTEATQEPVARKPFAIKVGAPAQAAFNEAVYHARNGYVFSDAPIELMPNGMAFFTMVQGNPLEHIIENAKDSARISAQQEEHERQRSIREEAKRLVEDEKRVALAKQVAAIKAEQARQIAALEKAAAEAIAAL
jgi:hypothetical protein